jgi:hypothetical protein
MKRGLVSAPRQVRRACPSLDESARLGSVVKAGKELCITASAVGKRIAHALPPVNQGFAL